MFCGTQNLCSYMVFLVEFKENVSNSMIKNCDSKKNFLCILV